MTFYFYDLETSGFNKPLDRVMQFAGLRTDQALNPISEPDNFYIKMTPDILPNPEAVMVHGTTPQKTLKEGVIEAKFLEHFTKNIVKPDTIFLGFNSVRFDDEFMRYMMWRNFYDPYTWHWQDGCSRWDLLDMVRMTRALRPYGIKWPLDENGDPSNRLELLARANKLDHELSHDALGDVKATIALAKLIKSAQPRLFDYLLNMRSKKEVKQLVEASKPFIYTSGRYDKQYSKTTAAVMVAEIPARNSAVVYDLRINPSEFINLSAPKLAELWTTYQKDAPPFPFKVLQYNRCPAVAELAVLDDKSAERLKLDKNKIEVNLKKLKTLDKFKTNILKAYEIREQGYQKAALMDEFSVDEQLYDGFIPDADKPLVQAVREASAKDLTNLRPDFKDKRLGFLFLLYKARNFPNTLNNQEQKKWDEYRVKKLLDSGEASVFGYMQLLESLKTSPSLSTDQFNLLEELGVYAQSILPA